MIKALYTILLCFIMTNGYGQDKLCKMNTGYVRLYDDRMLAMLTFSFDNDYTDFINELEKEFGKAELVSNWYVWKKVKVINWSKKRCILRVQVNVYQILNLDKSIEKRKDINITLESRKGDDLLETGATSYESIRAYFLELINKTFIKEE